MDRFQMGEDEYLKYEAAQDAAHDQECALTEEEEIEAQNEAQAVFFAECDALYHWEGRN